MSKVLIVEDDKVLNSAYQMILEKDGHEVFTAFDGQQALDLVATNEPDIILLDLLMPNVGGITFLETYQPAQHPHVQIIVLSNMGDSKLVDQARELGAAKYIVKAHTSPGQLSKLIRTVAKV